MAEIWTKSLYVSTQKMGLFSFCDRHFHVFWSNLLKKGQQEIIQAYLDLILSGPADQLEF